MNYTLILYSWKDHIYHKGISWNFQSILGSGIIRKEKRVTVPDNQSFLQSWIPSKKTRKKNFVILSTRFLKNNTMRHIGNATFCVFYTRLSRTQDQGLLFWQTKFICAHHLHNSARRLHWSSDFSERRWSTFRPIRPPPKVPLKSYWQIQQQQPQQPKLEDDTQTGNSVLPGKAEQQCETIRLQKRLSLWEKNSLTRIQKPCKNQNWFEQKFEFKKTLQRKRWCSAKNPTKPLSTWVTSNSSSWRRQRSSAHRAFTTYLKELFSAIAVSC